MPKYLQSHLAAKDWDLLAVGIPLTSRVPERGEAKADPKLTVRARIGVGWSGLEGTF